ncbi:MAG: hypothetical protein AAGF15_04975 [Pseudomonadota bacterium]
MITIVSRFYGDEKKANKAAAALVEDEFNPRDIDVIVGKKAAAKNAEAPSADVDKEKLALALKHTGVSSHSSKKYIDALAKGGALVVVRAPFGWTKAAAKILDEHGPKAVKDVVEQVFAYDGSVSTRTKPPINIIRANFNRNNLISSDSKVMSSGDRPGLLKNGQIMTAIFGPPLRQYKRGKNTLLSESTPFSKRFGLPILKSYKQKNNLSKRRTPFSAAIGLPLLYRSGYRD